MNEAMQTPITDLLARVPTDACLSYEHCPTHHQHIPFGRLAAEALAEISRLTAENERLHKLCPSMVEFDTNEALHPESTITVAVGYLHTLLEKDAEIAELQADLKETAAVRDDACSLIADTNNALAICRAENAALAKLLDKMIEWNGLNNRSSVDALVARDEIIGEMMTLRAGQQKGVECVHEWIDPSNEVVTAGNWRMCKQCGLLREIGELPAAPNEAGK